VEGVESDAVTIAQIQGHGRIPCAARRDMVANGMNSRLLRQSIFSLIFGPVIIILTVGGWLTIWPLMAFSDWLSDGEVSLWGIMDESLGPWNEFVDEVRAVK
jgi:hypothetical protein